MLTASLLVLGVTAVAALAVVQVPSAEPDGSARLSGALVPPAASDHPAAGRDGAAPPSGTPEEPDASDTAPDVTPDVTSDAAPPRSRALPPRPAMPKPAGPQGVAARGALGAAPRDEAHVTAVSLRSQARRVEQRLAAHRRWGLPTWLPQAPPPPRRKVRVAGLGPIYRVPTRDRVIFLTADDGWEKDPHFLELLRDLQVPLSSFVTHEAARGGYGYFRQLRLMGNGVHNHTVTHPELTRLPFREQRREICRQQRHLAREVGTDSGLFRPPYGAWNATTVRAARECGVRTMVLWSLEAWADHVDFPGAEHRLRPGDIVLTHFRGPGEWGGTMVDMARRVLRMAAEQGFAVARLEDYLAD